ncbi:MAG: response regulator [Terriglobales bacterium]
MNQAEPVPGTISQPLPLSSDTQLSQGRATILLVEDETLVRETMFETLVWAGYRVLKASHAAEARTAFRRCRKVVGLLLTDVVLPDKNGKELAEEFREICPELKAILISGYPGVFTLATLLVVAFRAPCSAPRAPVAIAIEPKRLDITHSWKPAAKRTTAGRGGG